MLLAETTFLDVFWWMIVFFFWVMYFWLFVTVIGDVVRRDDISGLKKAAWVVLMIFLPLLGILIYMIVRPRLTTQDVRDLTRIEAAQKAAAGVSVADEVAKLSDLHRQGVLTDAEFAEMKRKAMA
jgi:hypothetical protein